MSLHLPWHFSKYNVLTDSGGRSVISSYEEIEVSEEAMDFIVLACNSHEHLVTALRDMTFEYRRVSSNFYQQIAWDKARAVLEQVSS